MKLPLRDIPIQKPCVVFAAVGAGWLVLDQLVKMLQRTFMVPGQSIAVIKDVFHLTYLRNDGAAFSVLTGQTAIFLIATIIATFAIWLFWKLEKPRTLLPVVGTALLLGGSFGNAIDRLASGHVLDLFDARIINFAVFNVADTGITIGIVLVIAWMLFFGGFASVQLEDEPDSSEEATAIPLDNLSVELSQDNNE